MTNATTPRDIVEAVLNREIMLESWRDNWPTGISQIIIEALQRAGHLNEWRPIADLLRQHRCNSDGTMTVGECVDSGRCGCSCGLILPKPPGDSTT